MNNPGQFLNVKNLMNEVGIEANMRVADLGCGNLAPFVFAVSPMIGDKGTAYAVDVQKQILEKVKSQAESQGITNIVTIHSDLEIFGATKIMDASLDVAMLINTLYQSSKRMNMMRESLRLLKSNGKLLIVEWKRISSPFGPEQEMRVAKEEITQMADTLKIQLIKEFDAGEYHYGLIFVKL